MAPVLYSMRCGDDLEESAEPRERKVRRKRRMITVTVAVAVVRGKWLPRSFHRGV